MRGHCRRARCTNHPARKHRDLINFGEERLMKFLLPSAALLAFGAFGGAALAQTSPDIPPSSLISKSTVAIGFTVGGGSTKVDLTGTELMPQASGEAKVE